MSICHYSSSFAYPIYIRTHIPIIFSLIVKTIPQFIILGEKFNDRAIKYYLKKNPFTHGDSDHSAHVAGNKVYDGESVMAEMLKRGTTITAADITAVLLVFYDVVGDLVADGSHVNLPIANIKPRISGVFSSSTDEFDRSRHCVAASLTAGKILRAKLGDANAEKTKRTVAVPILKAYTDILSQTTNQLVTRGGIGEISGTDLKFNHTNTEEGVFFIDASGNAIKATMIAKRTKGTLVFAIPQTLTPAVIRCRSGKDTAGQLLS